MAYQSPLISIPRKTTSDVDWSGPIRTIIAQSYGEDPSRYSEECSVLSRCRQDAVRGAGSDQTGRDLLYKYFGQLELLELRFAEIKVSFLWNDAFTSKPTTQSSLAFEKASIIHLLSAVLSSIAAQGSRSDPEGVKRAYYHTRASAGMLTYINENFLHAPSTDLSREVVHLLVGVMSAQATEIFTEKLVEEKKSPALVCRSANQAAGMYNTLVDEMKEFQGKGILDRNWLYILQIKAKLFISLAQYYRSVADSAAGKHGSALVRIKLADTAAQDAQRQANTFTYTFVAASTPSLPHDAATSLQEITKAHATLCAEAKDQAQRDNDLIYHEIMPSEASLPPLEKLPPAAPITIQEIYGNPDVSKLIGPDIFIKLVPLAVHESASVYSEEKAKVVRGEVERVDMNEGEIRAGLEHLGFPSLVSAWRALAEDSGDGDADVEISSALARLSDEVRSGGTTDHLVRTLETERERCDRELRELNGMLDTENRECERARAKYTPQFTQSPSGQQTAHLRSNISSNLGTLSTAASSDAQIVQSSQSIQADVALLSSGRDNLQKIARDVASGRQVQQQPAAGMSLLDLEDDYGATPSKSGLDDAEKENLRKAVADANEKLDRLGKIRRERDEVLKDLKEKIQNDDVSSLLMLNRRSQNVEPQLFATELEKFRPYQGRLASAEQASRTILQELEALVGQVERGKGVKERQRAQRDRQKRVRDWERKLLASGNTYQEIRADLGKATSYYESLQTVIADLRREVKSFVSSRDAERSRMVSEIETRQRLGSSPPPPTGLSPARGLESQLAGMSLGGGSYGSSSPAPYPASPPPKPSPYGASAYPPPPPHVSTPGFPPPPPKPSSPYSTHGSTPSPYPSTQSSYPALPPPRPEPPAQPRQSSYGYTPSQSSYLPPPPSRPAQSSYQSYQPPSAPASQAYPTPPPPSSQYPSHPPPSSQYPSHPPPSNPYHGSSPPPPSQYPSYAQPSSHQSTYPSHPPPPPPQQHSYPSHGYQPPPQGQSYQPPPPPPQSGYPYHR